MNEGLTVFLNMDERELSKNEGVIRRIDELLLNCGMECAGAGNVYRPVDKMNRDHAVFAACRALRSAAWLKDKLACTPIMNRTNACSMEQIRPECMSEPAAAKLKYYEKYYLESHELAHGIVVDEDGRMRDGYTSYVIAKKYGVRPDIYEALAGQPLRKIVRGRHVSRDGHTWKAKSDRSYGWNYTLKNPVVPGDILQVKTQKGRAFICVDEIDYVTGEEFCREHRDVIRHMKKRLRTVR